MSLQQLNTIPVRICFFDFDGVEIFDSRSHGPLFNSQRCVVEVDTRRGRWGRAKKEVGSGGKLPISFIVYERFRVICYLSLFQWLLFVADVTHAKNHVLLICSVGLFF